MTLARISIEAGAWTDPRFAMLAKLLGLADAEHALIRCARVWAWQTERYTEAAPTHVVAAELLDTLIAPGAAAAMVRAGLAEELPEGFRIRGSEGRIEWLANRRRSAKLGGRARKMGTQVGSKRARRDNSDDESDGCETGQMDGHVDTQLASHVDSKRGVPDNPHPSGLPHPTHVPTQNPALLSGSRSDLQKKDQRGGEGSGSRAYGPEPLNLGATRDRVQAGWPRSSTGDPRAQEQARLVRVIGDAHREAHARLRREMGCDQPSKANFVPVMRDVGDPARARLQELIASQVTLDGFEERARHVLTVAEHEVRLSNPPSMQWFGAVLWSDRSYARRISMSVADVEKQARPPERESLTAKSLRRVAELEALEAEEERRAVDGHAL